MTAQQAQAIANQFLSDRLLDRFTADRAQLSTTGEVWHVPVILTYPVVGFLSQVGEIFVSTTSKAIVSHTMLDKMKAAGLVLYERH